MSVTINGTTGVAGVDGSASTPAFQGTDTNTGIVFPAADTVTVATGGTERMRVDSSGNLTINNNTSYRVKDTAGNNIRALIMGTDNIVYSGCFDAPTSGGSYVLMANGAERARITSGGYFKASNDGTYVSSTGTYHEFRQTADTACLYMTGTNASLSTSGVFFLDISRNTTNNSFYAISYYNSGAAAYKFRVADSGNVTNTNNSYGSISDVKLKQDIVDVGSQWNDIKNLRVRKYRWKSDPNGFMQIGLVAQEAELVSPGLIDEHFDYEEVEVTNEEGNTTTERQLTGTTTKAIKYSILYMKAVKALQEAMERIETLEVQNAAFETRLAALEAK